MPDKYLMVSDHKCDTKNDWLSEWVRDQPDSREASASKKYFAKIDGNAQKPVKWPNWSICSPLMAILDFAVGSTVNESTHRC